MLDRAKLKEAYFALAAETHPDSPTGGSERFREIQESHRTLENLGQRLRHLLQLEFPEASVAARSPAAVGDLFPKVSETCHAIKALVERKAAVQTSVGRAVLAADVKRARERLGEVQQAVENRRGDLIRRLGELDDRWPDVAPEELAELAGDFTYVLRWRRELAEWEFRLENGK